MENKTAMQKLIDYMRANFHITESTEFEFEDSLLAEKEQIIDAYETGIWDVGCRAADSEQYYQETFKK